MNAATWSMIEKLPDVKSRLVHAVTAWDRAEAARARKRKGGRHNIYALALYFRAIDDALEMVDAGTALRVALEACFCGRILDIVLRAAGA